MVSIRLFPIVGEPARDFYAGTLPDGRQALISLVLPKGMVMAIFGTDGTLLEVVRRTLPSPPVETECDGYFNVDETAFLTYLKDQFGVVLGPIQVREFRLPGGELAVYRFPEQYQKFVQDPDNPEFDDEERITFPTRIEEWEQAGLFVLEVAPCDYWLDQTGEVIAS
jgi:hypothetical protein